MFNQSLPNLENGFQDEFRTQLYLLQQELRSVLMPGKRAPG